jgi:predicted metalloprotease
MRWKRGYQSRDVEDRRQTSGRRYRRSAGIGLGGLLILLLLSFLTGENFLTLFSTGSSGGGLSTGPAEADIPFQTTPEEEKLVEFVSYVLDDVQNTWQSVLPGYQNAKLVLFRDAIDSACGFAQAATGPFYCPADQKVYIDLGFYSELQNRFGAPGDFAQAYVLAHEIGHHVQNLIGVERQVRQQQQMNPGARNELSVRMELQADCFAGVWGRYANERGILEAGDVEEGLRAAAAIGDDRIQRSSGGYVNPETFTHGSSEQRVTWLHKGLSTGNPESCDTFSQR